jgi:hypothetical protein
MLGSNGGIGGPGKGACKGAGMPAGIPGGLWPVALPGLREPAGFFGKAILQLLQ